MTRDDLKKIQEHKSYPSITLLIPTHRKMPERKQDPIKVKNAVSQATERLLEEFEKNEVLPILKTIDSLVEKIDYTKVLDGLALFANRSFSEIYNLPFNVEEKVIIDKSFSTKDLVKALNRTPKYWVLSVSQDPTRLFKAVGNNLEEIIASEELQDQMKGFPFKLNYDVTSSRELLSLATGDLDTKYESDKKYDFMYEVDKLLANHIAKNSWPIILLGTEKNRSYFEKITKFKDLIAGHVEGDYSRGNLEQITQVSYEAIQKHLESERKNAMDEFINAVGKGNFVSGIKKTWQKALDGHIHKLLIEEDYKVPATINKENPEIVVTYEDSTIPGISDDLVDALIEQVIATNGKIIFVKPGELKDYNQIGGILRF